MLPLINLDQKLTSPASTRVILMRHGQSTYNAEKRHQGSSDVSVLTASGRISSYQTGLILRRFNISAVYVSPLQRAQETAQEVIEAIATETDQLPLVITHPNLKEISLPLWEKLPYCVVREQFADEYRCWKEQPHLFQMMSHRETSSSQKRSPTLTNPAEHHYPVLELYARVEQFWRDILPHHANQTLLIVSHAGTNRALISTAINMPPKHFHALQQSNCGISVLRFPNSTEQTACLEVMNSTDHLGEVLPKLKEGKQGLRLLVIPSNGTNPDRIQVLAKRLETVEIDFSISNSLDNSQQTIEQLLRHHPRTVQLQVMQEDFPQTWQKILMSRHSQKSLMETTENRPLTALLVAQEAVIFRFLSQVLEIHPQSLKLISDSLTVVHYPQMLVASVLQAMNMTESIVDFMTE